MLVLSRSSDVEVAGEVSEKLRNLLLCHVHGMTFLVINNEALDPIDVSLFGTNAVMLASNDVADLIKQFRFVSN